MGRRRDGPSAGEKLGVELDHTGRVKVNPDLSLPGHPEVLAIGDLALVLRENGLPVPGVAPAAMQMARHAARLIRDELDLGPGRQPRRLSGIEIRARSPPLPLRRVAQLGKIKLEGFPAWLAWLVVHLVFLIGFRNKAVCCSPGPTPISPTSWGPESSPAGLEA